MASTALAPGPSPRLLRAPGKRPPAPLTSLGARRLESVACAQPAAVFGLEGGLHMGASGSRAITTWFSGLGVRRPHITATRPAPQGRRRAGGGRARGVGWITRHGPGGGVKRSGRRYTAKRLWRSRDSNGRPRRRTAGCGGRPAAQESCAPLRRPADEASKALQLHRRGVWAKPAVAVSVLKGRRTCALRQLPTPSLSPARLETSGA
jgi:hypothetical protein